MVIGGNVDSFGDYFSTVELVSLDPSNNPVPECIKNLADIPIQTGVSLASVGLSLGESHKGKWKYYKLLSNLLGSYSQMVILFYAVVRHLGQIHCHLAMCIFHQMTPGFWQVIWIILREALLMVSQFSTTFIRALYKPVCQSFKRYQRCTWFHHCWWLQYWQCHTR